MAYRPAWLLAPVSGPAWVRQAPPIVAFAAATAFNLYIAVHASGLDVRQSQIWVRWDSFHYLQIASRGYELFPCGTLNSSMYDPRAWCGNAGWFPGYPWAIRVLGWTGVPLAWAGVLLSTLAFLGVLVLLWRSPLESRWTPSHLMCLALAAVFPGQVYYHAVFPVSLVTLGTLGCLFFAARDRCWIAGLLGALAAFTHPTGMLLVPVLLVAGMWTWRHESGFRALRLGLVVLFVTGGFLLVFAVHAWATGHWNAFFLIQAKYGHGLHDPVRTLLAKLASPHPRAPALQTLMVLTLVVAALASALSQTTIASEDLLLVVYTATFWAFPLIMGEGVSLYRAEALLLPCVPLLRRLPWPVLGAFVVAWIYVAYRMAVLFFAGALV